MDPGLNKPLVASVTASRKRDILSLWHGDEFQIKSKYKHREEEDYFLRDGLGTRIL